MKEKTHILSKVRIKRLQVQGYCKYSDTELNTFKYGIRFAYAVCAVIVFSGLLTHNVNLFIIAAGTAFLGVFPPYHPFDYLYNYIIRHGIHQPKIPPRNIQGRFACGIATTWLSLSIYF